MRLALFLATLTCMLSQSHAQQYVLKNGTVLPFNTVSPNGNAFTANVTKGTAVEVVNFTVTDIASISVPTPPEFSQAKSKILSGQPEEAIALTTAVLKANDKLKSVEGSPWAMAFMIQLDALEALRKSSFNSEFTSQAKGLPKTISQPLNDMISIIESGKKEADVAALLDIAKNSEESFVQARAYLRAGDILLALGKHVDAVKTYLRVPDFYATEKYLSARATFAAAATLHEMKRDDDMTKLLDDYISDNFDSDYLAQAKATKEKLSPKKKNGSSASQ